MRYSFASLLSWIRRRRTQRGPDEALKEDSVTLDQLGATLKASEDLLAGTRPLEEEDFTLIGKFIQIYCYSDLNARRIIDTMHFARTGREEEFASNLNEKDVLMHLEKCAEPWVRPKHIVDGIRSAAVTLNSQRDMRHNFAHWAVRRTADGNGYVIWTMHANEVKKRGLAPHGRDEATRGLMLRRRVVEETERLEVHAKYLAALAAHFHAHRAELRALYLTAIGVDADTPSP